MEMTVKKERKRDRQKERPKERCKKIKNRISIHNEIKTD
jgi:hypothetical protein